MAAIFSGIHLKLKSPQTPWEDKLKLARFAWVSSQCLLPNKEQVLLDWCTHALTGWYSQKVEFSQDVLEGLWLYLNDLLRSQKLQSLLKQGKTVSLRLNMAQLLLDRLQEYSHTGSTPSVSASLVLSVCQGVVSCPVLSSVFITKYELMVDLLVKLCAMACVELQQQQIPGSSVTESSMCSAAGKTDCRNMKELSTKPDEGSKSSLLFELLLQVLTCYLAVQRQQANPNRVLVMLLSHLFQPFVLLRHLLTSADLSRARPQLHQQMRRDICLRIDSVLLFALFPSEHLTSYKEELLPTKGIAGKSGAGGSKGPLKPVTAILSKLTAQDYCEKPSLYSLKANTVSLLFRFFLDSYAKGKGENDEEQKLLCFHFLTRLVPILDLGPDMQSRSPAEADPLVSARPDQTPSPASPTSPQNWSLALTALESLLSQAVSADIYNVAADRIRHGEIQLNFFRALGQILLNKAQPSIPAWHHCFKVLLSLNHQIVEPDLDQLLSLAWVNFECTDGQVEPARQVLVCGLLQIYTKLRQLPHLFSELLSVICQPALEELRPPLLFDGFYSSLSSCLLDTPLSQSLEICSLVLDGIKKYILPDLGNGGQGDKEMADVNQKKRRDSSLKLLSLSQLLHTVLFHTKSIDSASPLPLVKQVKALMSEMHQVVGFLQQLMSDENPTVKAMKGSGRNRSGKVRKSVSHQELEKIQVWAQKMVEATLILRYSWVEVDMLFDLHCSKYKHLGAEVMETDGEDVPSATVMTHTETHGCVYFLPTCLSMSSSTSPVTCLFDKLITLQQVKKLMLDNAPLSESSVAAVKKAVTVLLAKLKSEVNTGLEHEWDGQICNVNSDSYAVAYWYLVTTNLPLIAPYLSEEDKKCFTDVLVTSLLSRQKDDKPRNRLTVATISSQFLESPLLPELPSLFSSFVCCLTQRIRDVLIAAHRELRFSRVMASESIVLDILETSTTGDVCVTLTGAQVEELTDLVRILRDLNPDAMNSEDLCSVFFLLLFMLTSTCQQDPVGVDCRNDLVPTAFFVRLLTMLNFLVQSSNLKGVLKVIRGGPLLQTVVSCLRWHSSNRRFATTSDAPISSGLIKAEQNFIGSLVQFIIINNISVQLNLDHFVSFLTQNVRPNPEAFFPCVYLELASLSSLAQVLNSNCGRSKSLDQTLMSLLSRVTVTLGSATEFMLKPQTASTEAGQLDSDFYRSFVVEIVTVLLECESTALSVATAPSFKHMTLYQELCQQILKDLSANPRPMDFLVSSLRFLSTFYKAVEKKCEDRENEGGAQEALYVQILQGVCSLLTASWLSSENICELEPTVEELLQHLTEKSTTHHLTLLLVIVKDGLHSGKLKAGNYREVLSAVIITKLLFSCRLPDNCSQALWLIAPEIISAMVFLVRSCSQDVFLTLAFAVPTVIALTSILRHGEGLLSNPHHVVVALEALQCVSLDHSSPHGYLLAFQAVHEGLFAVIQCHSQVMLNAAPSFLNVFSRLVTSVMCRGQQRGHSKTGSDDDVYLQCSRLIERMYSHIAVTSENFTTLSAYIVAQYVTELQKVTLRADIKLHLTEGIYQILDLCTERDIKFLMSGLHMGVREVFNELYSSYTHYHKTQRQGEEKYTV